MTVYVDDMRALYGRMVMCHMIADTSAELLTMACKVGIAPRWLQRPQTPKEHFDVSLSGRKLAVKYGAVEITQRQAAMMMKQRRVTGVLGNPATVEAWLEEYKKSLLVTHGVPGLKRGD